MNSKISGYILVLALLIGGCIFFKSNLESQSPAKEDITRRIDKLTREEVVVPYVRKNKKLPEYYVTKHQATERGWEPSKGNLCEIWPGKAIGGDAFYNREKQLPTAPGRKWFEADLNYNCGRRNANRLLYSNDGLIYVTYDHYKTFQKK